MKIVFNMLILSILFSLAGCGGGNGSTETGQTHPVRISLRMVSSGTITKNLATVSLTVILPSGFYVDIDNSGKPVSTVLTSTGVAEGIATIPTDKITYLAPTATTTGSISFEINSSTPAGFGTGEIASLQLIVAPGNVVIPTKFTATSITATDILGNTQAGITISFR